MARSRSENVVINTTWSIAMKLAAQLMGFILKMVFIYTLGEEYLNASTLFGDILSALALAELGIASAITYALYKPLKENDTMRIAALMNFYKKAYRLVALFIVLAGMVCLPFLSVFIKGNAPNISESIRLLFILSVIDSASTYLLIYKSTLLTASQQRYIISKISIIFSFIRTAVQCVLLLVFKNYILYLVFGIVENLVRNYIISRAADRRYPELKQNPKARLEKGETKKLLHDVFALSLYKINSVVLTSTDTMIISGIFETGFQSIGPLGLTRTIINTVDAFVNQFFNASLPSLGNLATDATGEKQFFVFRNLLFVTFWCCCFSATSLLTLTTPFIQIIRVGENFALPMSILAALLLDNYVNCMMRPIYTFRNSNGLFVQGKYRPLIMSIINIALSIALARPLGIFGVLIATTISRLCTSVWYDPWLVYSRVFHVNLWDYTKRHAAYAAVTLVSCLTTFFLARLIPIGGILGFALKIVLCLIIPNGLVVALYRRTEEYAQFMAQLEGILGRIRSAVVRRFHK